MFGFLFVYQNVSTQIRSYFDVLNYGFFFFSLTFSPRYYLFASVTSIVVYMYWIQCIYILYIHLSIMGPETVYAFTDMTVIRCDG